MPGHIIDANHVGSRLCQFDLGHLGFSGQFALSGFIQRHDRFAQFSFAQKLDVSLNSREQLVSASFGFWDNALRGKLLNPPFRDIEEGSDHLRRVNRLIRHQNRSSFSNFCR